MVLATHAATGALLAALVPAHPAAAFALGFCSHFLLDTIPHWDYHLSSLEGEENPLTMRMPFGKKFLFDLLRVGADFSLGIILGCLVFSALFHFSLTPAIVVGAAAATLPDFLTFMYTKFPYGILRSIMDFHMAVHAKLKIKDWKIGVPLQAAMVACFCLIFLAIR